MHHIRFDMKESFSHFQCELFYFYHVSYRSMIIHIRFISLDQEDEKILIREKIAK